MSLHFELWPVVLLERYVATVLRLVQGSTSITEDQVSVLRAMALASDLAGSREDSVTAFLGAVLASAEVEVAHDPAPPAPTPARAAPRVRWGRWTKEKVFDNATRIAASAADDGQQLLVGIGPSNEFPAVRRTLWRPSGPLGFWYDLGAPPSSEWITRSPEEIEALERRRPSSPKAPWYPVAHHVPVAHRLTTVAAVARDVDHRLVVVNTEDGETFSTRWNDGAWDADFARLGDLAGVVDSTATSYGPDHEEVFAVTREGTIHSTWCIRGGWSDWIPWQLPGGLRARAVATASRMEGHEELFVLGEDGMVRHRWRTEHGSWTPGDWDWPELGSRSGGERIAAAGTAAGMLVAAVGDWVRVRRYSGGRQDWLDWHDLGPTPGGGPARDVAVVRTDQEDLFTLIVLSGDGQLHRRHISLTP